MVKDRCDEKMMEEMDEKKLDEKSLILFKGWREGEQIEDREKRKNETMERREKEEKRKR